MPHEKFHYHTEEELKKKEEELGISLPFAKDTGILKTPLSIGKVTLPNRLGIAPMEGADSLPDGSPSDLTRRRYVRETKGGAAVIWFEAIAVTDDGRSSKSALALTEETKESFKKLVSEVKEAGMAANGFAPFLIMQANHSGRYANPDDRPAPLIAYRNPELEKSRVADDSCIASDDELKRLSEKFGEAARLAKEVGFDAVDIKCCHGYLLAELTSAYDRPGAYGGSYENRTRLLKESVRAAKAEESEDFTVTCRLGIYDGFPYPYGFGVSRDGSLTPDYEEPIRLVRELCDDFSLSFMSLTMGNPYVTTHVTRPFDHGKYVPDEHPLLGISRMITGIGAVKKAVPEMTIFASAPTYLRQFSDLYAAGAVLEGDCDGMLFGRMAFADPDFADEIVKDGRIHPEHVCVTCGMCGDLIRAHRPTGCVAQDSEIYLPYYREMSGKMKKERK